MERQTLATITEIFQWYLENIFDMQNLRERCFLLQKLFWKSAGTNFSSCVILCRAMSIQATSQKEDSRVFQSAALASAVSDQFS